MKIHKKIEKSKKTMKIIILILPDQLSSPSVATKRSASAFSCVMSFLWVDRKNTDRQRLLLASLSHSVGRRTAGVESGDAQLGALVERP